MRQVRSFWAGFALLCGACVLGAANPCVGVFAVAYLVLALVALAGYAVVRDRARALASGSPAFDRAREQLGEQGEKDARWACYQSARAVSRMLFGTTALLSIVVTVTLLVLVMIGLDPEAGGRALFPVQVAPLDAALDLWAMSAVMAVAAAFCLVTAGASLRRGLIDPR